MDFITHSMVGVGAARLICPRRDWLPQVTLSAVLGSLLMDADALVALGGLNYYGFYHRVFTHSAIGLTGIAMLSMSLAWLMARWPMSRRFGWFLTPDLSPGTRPGPAPWRLFVLTACVAAALHWCGDVITGYGNLQPFWPWSTREASMHLVSSFDWPIFLGTITWFLTARLLEWPRRREALLTGSWAFLTLAYLAGRELFTSRSIW